MITVTCETCAKQVEKHPYQMKKTKRHFCSRDCWNKAPRRRLIEEKTRFTCSLCGQDLHKSAFKFYEGRRGDWTGTLRRSQCISCTAKNRKQRYEERRTEELTSNTELHKRKLSNTDDSKSLRWALKRRIGAWRRRHRKLGYGKFDLSVEWLLELFNKQKGLCHYTGQKMIWRTAGVGKGRLPPNGMSLDRVNNEKGYTKDNVVFSTYKANLLKRDLPLNDFYQLCEAVIRTRSERAGDPDSKMR